MSLYPYKIKLIEERIQALALSFNGFLLDSCHTLFHAEAATAEPVYNILKFLKPYQRIVENLEPGDERRFKRVAVQKDEQSFLLDINIRKTEDKVIVLLFDITEFAEKTSNAGNEAVGENNNEKGRLRKSQRILHERLAQIMHDIKLPLTEIIGTTYLLKNFVSDSKAVEYVKALSNSARTLDNMLNDLLNFSKLEAAQLRLEEQSFQFKETLDAVKKSFEYRSREKDVPLRVEVADGVPDRLVGDPNRFSQIIFNLLDNAFKFTHEGHIDVKVGLESASENRCKLSIRVQDTGIGIPVDRLTRIFDSYEQLETNQISKGFGLGLSIVKQLVELQGGKIQANSKLGSGTSFSFTLPFGVESSVEAA